MAIKTVLIWVSLGLQCRSMIKIVLAFIVQILWGSSSSNDRLALQASPNQGEGLSSSAEEAVIQETRESRRVETLQQFSAMLASVAQSWGVREK